MGVCSKQGKDRLPEDPRDWTADQISTLAKEIFQNYDVNHDSTISVSELAALFGDLQETMEDFGSGSGELNGEAAAATILEQYDVNHDASLDFKEFLPLFKTMLDHIIHHDTVAKVKLRALENVILSSHKDAGGVVRLVLVGLNYEGSPEELTGISDCKRMLELARNAGVDDISEVYDDRTTKVFPFKQDVVSTIKTVGRRCSRNDVFVFFYAGHGTNVPDTNGDEDDGMDEAFCTVDRDRDITEDSVLVDDDFSAALAKHIPVGCRVLVITDCCHSGSIVDLDSTMFPHPIIAISAAKDEETAEEAAEGGGAMTGALASALVEVEQQAGGQEYSMYAVFEHMKKYMQGHDQTIGMQQANITADEFPWPMPQSGALTTGWHLKMDG